MEKSYPGIEEFESKFADNWNSESESEKDFLKIKKANRLFSLELIFSEYKLNFFHQYTSNGWDRKRSCPFSDHCDQTPSFYYNSSKNLFKCFGCQRSGKAVQFLAYFKKISEIDAAKLLLEKKFHSNENIFIEKVFSQKEIFNLMDNFANIFAKAIKICEKKDLEILNNISFVLESYMKNSLLNDELNQEALNARIQFCIEKIKIICPKL